MIRKETAKKDGGDLVLGWASHPFNNERNQQKTDEAEKKGEQTAEIKAAAGHPSERPKEIIERRLIILKIIPDRRARRFIGGGLKRKRTFFGKVFDIIKMSRLVTEAFEMKFHRLVGRYGSDKEEP